MSGLTRGTELDHRTPIAMKGLVLGTLISIGMWAVIIRIIGWLI